MKKVIYSAALVLTLVLGACSDPSVNYSPQEVIDQVLQDTAAVSSYAGEYVMDIGDGDVTTIKEWVKDGKRRIELSSAAGEQFITVNDGQSMTMFDVKANTVQVYDSLGTDSLPNQSPKEQAQVLLNMVEDTHEISMAGEEEIAGRETYHIVAESLEENSLMGDMEIWVDKEKWLILKMISSSGDITMTTEYKTIDYKSEVEDALFTLDIPQDATVETIDTDSYQPKQVTLEEAKATLGSFLVLKEENGINLITIEDMQMEERPEFALTYTKEERPFITLSILESTMSYTEFGEKVGDEVMIRGQKGEQMDMGAFRYVQWTEGKQQYGVILDDPDITFEEVYAMIENMEFVK